MVQRIHQSGGLANLARILECVLSVRERGIGIAKHPQSHRPIGQALPRDVLAKSRRQRTMLGRIVKRERPIEMRPAFGRCLPYTCKDVPMMRCPIMSGTVAPCFSARARNCAASSRTRRR